MAITINAMQAARGRVVCDFGEGPLKPGESVTAAALRIYREWCQPEQGERVTPDPHARVVVHG